MSFIKIGEYTINSRYIQYAKEHHGNMLITFGEGSATESATISKEEWEAVQRSIAFFEGAPRHQPLAGGGFLGGTQGRPVHRNEWKSRNTLILD